MAYSIKSKKSETKIPYLPLKGQLKDNRRVTLDYYTDKDEGELHAIFVDVVEAGDSYPQDSTPDVNDFRSFYLSHETFVCHDVTSGEVLGGFYIKPNYPGRCSHNCNGGFIVKQSARGLGICSFMVTHYLQLARDLGYRASIFNLVFVTNKVSVGIWKKFGFKEIGRIPNAGYLNGHGYTDALLLYYDLTNIEATTTK